MNLTVNDVLRVLATVEDPDLRRDLVTLNMVKDVKVTPEKISFTVVLTTPACPLKEKIKQDCLLAVGQLSSLPIEILMTSSVTSLRDNAPLLPGVKNILAIASGKGGVGKSTVTSNLAVALSLAGAKVGLIDADIYGPSIPTMFHCEHEQPLVKQENGRNIIIPVEQYGVKLISIGFLTPPDSAIVWRGPMASSALKQFFSDADWGELDYLLIDLPPGTSDIHLTMVQTVPVTGAVVVTTPQKVAMTDALKAIQMFRQPQINVPILGIVENMAYFIPEELPDHKYFIFGKDGGEELANRFEVPLLGKIPLVQGIRESGDSGLPAALKGGPMAEAFMDLAKAVARQIAIRNAGSPTQKVEITT